MKKALGLSPGRDIARTALTLVPQCSYTNYNMLCRLAIASALPFSIPAFAGLKEDALAAYQKFFEAFTTYNGEQVAALFAPDALFYGTGFR
jgi:hypothetical protein